MSVSRSALIASLLWVAACGKDPEKSADGPCQRGELAACGTACANSVDCPSGLYCDQKMCKAECTAASALDDCGSGMLCTVDGRCNEDPSAVSLDGSLAEVADGGVGEGDGSNDNGNVCGSVNLDSRPVIPTVILIIDQSSSMDEKFGTSTRWQSLRDSLLSDNGLIKELQNSVRFGATFYSAKEGNATCPMLTEVSVALGNFEAIKAKYPAKTIADTPTGDAIDAVLAKLPKGPELDPTAPQGPTIFVLATDGEPDRCEQLNPQNGQQEAIDAVKRAYGMNIRTYVIAVANEVGQKHLNDLANAGIGNTTASQAPSWRANDDKGLRDALRSIVAGEVSCDVPLKGTVTGSSCSGTIRIAGKDVPCNDPNGYELIGTNKLRLKGTACDAIKTGQTLTARFPCGSAIPLL
jgi:hypothetical protein